MAQNSAIKFARDLLALQTAKEIRDYVAIHGFEIWQLPVTSLLTIQLLCLVEVVDCGGDLNLCLDRIEGLLVEAN